jgi:hypothetical protein
MWVHTLFCHFPSKQWELIFFKSLAAVSVIDSTNDLFHKLSIPEIIHFRNDTLLKIIHSADKPFLK